MNRTVNVDLVCVPCQLLRVQLEMDAIPQHALAKWFCDECWRCTALHNAKDMDGRNASLRQALNLDHTDESGVRFALIKTFFFCSRTFYYLIWLGFHLLLNM